MNPDFRFTSRKFAGEPSISFCPNEKENSSLIISIGDAFLDMKTMSMAVTRLLLVDENTDVLILINSPGGNVATMRTLLSAMAACKAKITTHITGIAASCGAITWLYGDTLTMSESARVMFHGSSHHGVSGNTVQLAESLEAHAQLMKELMQPALDKNILTEAEFTEMVENKTDIYLSKSDLQQKGALK